MTILAAQSSYAVAGREITDSRPSPTSTGESQRAPTTLSASSRASQVSTRAASRSTESSRRKRMRSQARPNAQRATRSNASQRVQRNKQTDGETKRSSARTKKFGLQFVAGLPLHHSTSRILIPPFTPYFHTHLSHPLRLTHPGSPRADSSS